MNKINIVCIILLLSQAYCGAENYSAFLACESTCKTTHNCEDGSSCANDTGLPYFTKLFNFEILECNKKYYIQEREKDYSYNELIAANAACYDDFAAQFTANSDEEQYVLCRKQCEIDDPIDDHWNEYPEDLDYNEEMRDLDANVCIWECFADCTFESQCFQNYMAGMEDEDLWSEFLDTQDCVNFSESKCVPEDEYDLRSLNTDFAACWQAVTASIFSANSDEYNFGQCYATCAETEDLEFHECGYEEYNIWSQWLPNQFCELGCYQEYNCDDDCQEEMWQKFKKDGVCDAYLSFSGGRQDNYASTQAIDSAEQCWLESKGDLQDISSAARQSTDCVIDNCIFDPRRDFALDSIISDCKDNYCTYEHFECVIECDKCKDNRECWTDEDEAKDVEFKECDKYDDMREEQLRNWNRVIDKDLLDQYQTCVDSAESIFKSNGYSDQSDDLYSCHQKCAQEAKEEYKGSNSSVIRKIHLLLVLMILALLL